ncbi:hypothetical protein CRE_17711, partial [Caenorhabditis remanei]
MSTSESETETKPSNNNSSPQNSSDSESDDDCDSESTCESETEEDYTNTPESITAENFSLLSLYEKYEETEATVAINHIVETLQNKVFNPTKLASSSPDIRLPFTLLSTPKHEKILALVDTGAAISLISDRTAKKLGLKVVQTIQLSLTGVTGSTSGPCNIYQITFIGDSLEFHTYVAGVPHLAKTKYRKPKFSRKDKETMRSMKINYKNVTPDKVYDNTRMDMILGNDILPHFIRGSQRVCLPSGKYIEIGPFASMTFPNARHCPVMDQNMIPEGISSLEEPHPPSINVLMSQKYGTDNDDELTNLILQLWQTENCGIESATMLESEYLSQEYLLQLFEKEAVIGEDGLLYVALPWNGKQTRMGNNKSLAYKRLTCLIEKLRRNPDLLKAYNKIINEQLEAGIIERVTPEMKDQGPEYYAPQNAVLKENSTNTKVRIVGDSSSKQRDTLSLNDCLHEGPNLLKTAPGILLRHREKKYTAIGDIARAFHQIRLQEKDRNATKWLWIRDINKPPTGDNLVEFRFTRIPFGMKCSPFLLAATIRHYLLLAANVLSREIEQNLYVDNLMVTTNNPDEVLPKILAVQKQFREMGMYVREIATNHQPTMLQIPETDRAESNMVKFLGYIWNLETDTIAIQIPEPPEKKMTKRDVASFLAKLYDPMGYTAPLQVRIKRFVQLIWNDGLDWKQTLSDKLNTEWMKVKELYKHRTIEIPRQLRNRYIPNQRPEMALFCDASNHTYGNAIYILYRSEDGSAESTLIGAKSKVRPSNGSEWTIPRLETLAVEIGMRHSQSLIKELSDEDKPTKLDVFSDSTIALSWILTKEQTKQWVHNRVNSVHTIEAELKSMDIEVSFHHVATDQNPADLATRGLSSTELKASKLWFTGPALLKESRETWETQLEGE